MFLSLTVRRSFFRICKKIPQFHVCLYQAWLQYFFQHSVYTLHLYLYAEKASSFCITFVYRFLNQSSLANSSAGREKERQAQRNFHLNSSFIIAEQLQLHAVNVNQFSQTHLDIQWVRIHTKKLFILNNGVIDSSEDYNSLTVKDPDLTFIRQVE